MKRVFAVLAFAGRLLIGGTGVAGVLQGEILTAEEQKHLDRTSQGVGSDAPKWQEQSSTGLIPLNAMGSSVRYKGEDGGLCGGGKNTPPQAHQAAALQAAKQITPLDAQGQPSRDGKIGFISLGMSNTAGEFLTFKEISDQDPDKSPAVTLVNCAVGGAGVHSWTQASSGTWSKSLEPLKQAQLTAAQVQVAWIKHAEPMPDEDQSPLEYAKKVRDDIATSLGITKVKFPNLKIAYLSSRIYGGYNAAGRRRVNPEPFAYETAFSVRWVILDQINGQAHNYDPQRGSVTAPVLLWGPYLWADGINPRPGDGLVWQRSDFGEDGVHPTRDGGAVKVARMLLDFCKSDPAAKTWFKRR